MSDEQATKAETVAVFPLEHRQLAKEMLDHMLAEGRKVWLSIDTDRDLKVSIKEEIDQRQRIR